MVEYSDINLGIDTKFLLAVCTVVDSSLKKRSLSLTSYEHQYYYYVKN